MIWPGLTGSILTHDADCYVVWTAATPPFHVTTAGRAVAQVASGASASLARRLAIDALGQGDVLASLLPGKPDHDGHMRFALFAILWLDPSQPPDHATITRACGELELLTASHAMTPRGRLLIAPPDNCPCAPALHARLLDTFDHGHSTLDVGLVGWG